MRPGEDLQKWRLEEHFNIMKWQQRLQHTEKLHLLLGKDGECVALF